MLVAASMGATPGFAQVSKSDASAMAAGRELSAQFERGDVAAVWGRMNKSMRDALGDEAALRAFRLSVVNSAGTEVSVINENVSVDDNFHVYRRSARRAGGGVFVTTWTLDAAGLVAGFMIKQAAQPAPSAFLDYVTRTHMRLPFDGSWYVLWGGRTLAGNYHVVARDQRFAYDFVVRNGKTTHRGDGARNDDFFAWDRPIVAPAAGVVIRAVDGIDDNNPGTMNAQAPFGNHVILDLGNGEFAVFAHLRRGSITVRNGAHVVVGRVIGHCGNSGNSSEPHLHFHLQNSPREGDADGLPAAFDHYIADGAKVARGEPRSGERIRAQ